MKERIYSLRINFSRREMSKKIQYMWTPLVKRLFAMFLQNCLEEEKPCHVVIRKHLGNIASREEP